MHVAKPASANGPSDQGTFVSNVGFASKRAARGVPWTAAHSGITLKRVSMKMGLGNRGNRKPIGGGRTTVSVHLLGEVEVRRDDGRSMPVSSGRVALLLAYLLVNRSPQPRKHWAR